ncbi:amino acid racemase [Aurantiacibacter sp. MUD11]|uniref:aspartate/glutamate racemase family protein n=1 Tax=Aurantiacibacter sp. MUD11 TaxID=3003265 RepID=UPI0022AA6657|nr:amino acid racemase [Aurantiacibacter sp. MUD11]WAT18774.1 amino acid racemase [Aurantiacibacter sp. MUD11]
MRKLGLIGGLSWVSTRAYFERINRYVRKHHDPRALAPMVIESLDFTGIPWPESNDDWGKVTTMLTESANRLSDAGAEMIVIGANVLHKVYRDVEAEVDRPFLHIAECVGEKMKEDGVHTAALVGVRSVMTESFYRRRLVAHDIDLLPPRMSDVDALERIITQELMMGKATRDAERTLKSMFTDFERDGAKAVVMANTELEQVVDVDANILPVYDCTAIHAEAAARWIIGDQ